MAHASNKVTSFPIKPAARPAQGEGGSASRDGDPTNEILSLVEQLQDSSRDAKARLQMAEDERDQLSAQLEAIRQEAEASEAIAKTAEALRRERDRLQSQTATHVELIAELKRKADEANDAKDEARKKTEDILRQAAAQQQVAKKETEALKAQAAAMMARQPALEKEIAELRKQAADSSKAGGDSQKQVIALKQARDAASTQVAELKAKLLAMDDQLAEAGYERETLEKNVARANAELAPLREQVAALEMQLSLANAKCADSEKVLAKLTDDAAETAAQRDEARDALVALKAEHDAASTELRADRDGLAAKVAELDETISKTAAETTASLAKQAEESASIIAERDKLAAQVTEMEAAAGTLRAEKEELSKRVAEMGDVESRLNAELVEIRSKSENAAEQNAAELGAKKLQHDEALRERDQARARAQELDADVERMKHEIAAMAESLNAAKSAADEKDKAFTEQLQRSEEARKESEGAGRRADEAEKMRDAIALSLDEVRNSLVGAQKQIEMVITERDAIREQSSAAVAAAENLSKELKLEIAALKKQLEDTAPKLHEFDMLTERFETQRLDTIELSAQLENAHRAIKEMGASLAEARLLAKNTERRAGLAGRPAPSGSQNLEVKALSAFPHLEAALATRVSSPLIDAMKKTFQTFTRRPGDTALLNDLCGHAQMFGEESQRQGALVLARVASSFAMLLNELHLVPEQVTPAMLRTVSQTIEFLQTLVNQKNLDATARLDSVKVYAVDDDRGVCESLASALQSVGLPARTTQLPGEAVGELAGNRYDLVVLDVHLPELDGFELCTHIRNMALHTETPIIFITGDASMENRVKSSQLGGNDFLAKPFNFQELGLKALMLILNARLRLN